MEQILSYHSGTISARLDHSRRVLVQDVDFTLCTGESLAVIGETGSGKTMTALSVMGLLPSNVEMQQGQIRFLEKPLPADMHSVLGVEMVYIPQNGHEFLNPSRTVRRHLYDNLAKLGVPRARRAQAAAEKLAQVGFDEAERLLDLYPFQLSGGMAQRVTIAISACSRARLVIADEPTNGLDHGVKTAFRQLLRALFPDAAILLITHDIAVASFCDRVLVLCGGKMMETGPSADVLKSPRHPYTKALLAALVRNGMAESPVLRTDVGGCPFYRRCTQAEAHCKAGPVCHADGERTWWCR